MANARAFVRSVLRDTSQSTLHFKFSESMTIFEKIVVKTVEFYQLCIHFTQSMQFCFQNCSFYNLKVIKVSIQN